MANSVSQTLYTLVGSLRFAYIQGLEMAKVSAKKCCGITTRKKYIYKSRGECFKTGEKSIDHVNLFMDGRRREKNKRIGGSSKTYQ
jgi:hypothetical protein